MKMTPAVVAVPCLVLLLTWLSLRAANSDAELFDRAFREMDRFTMAEAALHRDVLSTRTGLLRNYDPLVKESNELDTSLDRLRETAAVDAETTATIDHLSASVAQQEDLIEQFKSNNALLQNSLAYFGLFSGRLGTPDRTDALVPTVSALAAAMLRLTLDTSPATAHEVESRLEALARQPVSPDDAGSVGALLAHGRLLHDLLPATDDLLKALCIVPGKGDADALRTMILVRQSASRETARRFRVLLYVASLLMVALLVYLGMQLRVRALALHRRAAFEHAIAGISTRFINARPQNIDAVIAQALAELADFVGADRAYFLQSGASVQRHVWSRKGSVYPPAWPDGAVELAARLPPNQDGVIHLPFVEQLPWDEDKAALVSAGLRGWVCVPRLGADGDGAILGFDLLRSVTTSHFNELGLLRMALDAVANAVGRERLESDRARLEQHLQQARRMETVGALASGIAHNFNNIAGAIMGHTEMAEGQVASDSRPARHLREIRRATERARDLIDQILTFGRRRDTRRRPIRICDLLAEAAALLDVSLPSGVELVILDPPDTAIVQGEHAQLQQVILNLCSNAAQAMNGSGSIEIHTEVQMIELPPSLSHGELAPGRHVYIAVSDTGRGMDEATLGRIFEPFFTTRLSGNGLGLATVREIVREHGGGMNVRSAPGAGSCFEVWLPCICATASASEEDVPALQLGHGETVLVIDDDREQVLRDEEILAALGYEPVGFTGAEDALSACRKAPARFDAVVVGHLAPAGSALELAAALHEAAPDLPILLATNSANTIDARSLVAAGISNVVHWPIIATEIVVALERSSALKRSEAKVRIDP